MRKQIRHMAQSKLSLIAGVRSAEELEFMQYGTLKLIFMEQVTCNAQSCEIDRFCWFCLLAIAPTIRKN